MYIPCGIEQFPVSLPKWLHEIAVEKKKFYKTQVYTSLVKKIYDVACTPVSHNLQSFLIYTNLYAKTFWENY